MIALAPDLSRREALRRVTNAFAANGIEAASDARFLTLYTLGLRATDLALRGETPVGPEGAARLAAAVERRLAGEPVARILGAWEFWGLPFALSPATLVPRPDTETLVEAALALFPQRDQRFIFLDLGTGSGCILVALLTERPNAFGIGLDRSYEALLTARANAAANGVADRAGFVHGDWCAPLRGPCALIVSNPPYIAHQSLAGLADEVRLHDPPAALDGGRDGLSAYRAILGRIGPRDGSPGLLASDGVLLFEVGHDQAEAVAELGRAAGLRHVSTTRDLAGHARVVAFSPRERDRLETDDLEKMLVAARPNR